MNLVRSALALSLVAVLLSITAFAQSSDPNPSMASGDNPADQAMMAGMAKMSRAMSAAPRTGNADQDFVAMMIPHHQGAVSMAEVELKYGHDLKMRRLAKSIIVAQEKEISEMRAWQRRHP